MKVFYLLAMSINTYLIHAENPMNEGKGFPSGFVMFFDSGHYNYGTLLQIPWRKVESLSSEKGPWRKRGVHSYDIRQTCRFGSTRDSAPKEDTLCHQI
jgi:hypothetical protein